jgi:hypothetical protein
MSIGCSLGWSSCPGSDASSSVSLTNDTTNKDIVNVLQRSAQSVASSTLMSQDITFAPCPYPSAVVWNCPGGFTVTQTMKGDIKTITDISSSQVTDIKAILSNKVQQNAKSGSDASTMFLSLSDSKSYSTVDVANHVTNVIEHNITQQTMKSIIDEYNIKQKMTLPACGTINASTCSFNQDMILSLVASRVIDEVTTALSSDTFLNSLKQSGDSTAKAKVSLLNLDFDSIAKMVLACVLLVVIMGIVAALIKHHQAAAKTVNDGVVVTGAASAPSAPRA